MERIGHARFVRLSVELEVVRAACRNWTPEYSKQLEGNLMQQKDVVSGNEAEKFHQLDYDFHRLICELSGNPLAFNTIQECKRKIDRLCVLSLGRESEADILVRDHVELAKALADRDEATATETIRRHLGRIDNTIEEVHSKHAEYFE
ncbi:FCD domain-containing protein [Ruegeria sp. ANG10]|uniref:GntR family transcriptional regulator n=1 Tax=Ruegeria sp. ANG10 TaxID=3042467 RepID=UPI0034527205